MSTPRRKRRVGLRIATGLAVLLLGILGWLGVVGVPQEVSAGTQTRICGVQVGITSTGSEVKMLGASRRELGVGDRVRVAPWCVVEVTGMTPGAVDDDGGGAVQLRWRLW